MSDKKTIHGTLGLKRKVYLPACPGSFGEHELDSPTVIMFSRSGFMANGFSTIKSKRMPKGFFELS